MHRPTGTLDFSGGGGNVRGGGAWPDLLAQKISQSECVSVEIWIETHSYCSKNNGIHFYYV